MEERERKEVEGGDESERIEGRRFDGKGRRR